MDLMRCFSLAGILLYHFMVEFQIHYQTNLFIEKMPYYTPNMHIATLCVGLFFMLSGAGLTLSSRESFQAKTFYRRRFLRLMVPYYLAYLFYLLYLLLRYRTLPFSGDIPLWNFLLTLIGMDGYCEIHQTIPTFYIGIGEWFLGALIIMYLLFPLLYKLMKKNPYVTMAAATICYLILVFTYQNELPSYENALIKLYDFILGMFLIQEKDRLKKWTLCYSIPVILSALFLKKEIPLPTDLKISLLCTAVFFLFLQTEGWLKKRILLQKFLFLLQKYSFEIYLLHHVIIVQFLAGFAGRISSAADILLLLIEILAVTWICSWILYQAEHFLYRKPGRTARGL